jgi:sigma-B regulation protein RsbU (phosphoserine phosphatase)
MNDSEELRKELIGLRHEKQVHDAQNRLFESVIRMVRSSRHRQMLKKTMQEALEVMTRFSGADRGSLFLLDAGGRVTDSILTRDRIRGKKRSGLIGRVLDKGLAGWVKQSLTAGLILDTETDERWVTLPGQTYTVRSALAVPILREDTLFGIITLMHSLPSHFDRTSVESICRIADQMAVAIENAKLYKELELSRVALEAANQSIARYSGALQEELDKGRKIQKDFLPEGIPGLGNSDAWACFEPALELSGDFYDLFQLSGTKAGFVVGDVSGKGVGSALFMALTRSLLRVFALSLSSDPGESDGAPGPGPVPEKVLRAVELANDYIAREHGREGMFATVFFGVVDLASGTVSYVNAGHEPVLVIGGNRVRNGLKRTGPALGPIPGAAYGVGTVGLEAGEILFAFTDGVTEATSGTGEFYTRGRLETVIRRGGYDSAVSFLEAVRADLSVFVGGSPRSDDITMLALRWLP